VIENQNIVYCTMGCLFQWDSTITIYFGMPLKLWYTIDAVVFVANIISNIHVQSFMNIDTRKQYDFFFLIVIFKLQICFKNETMFVLFWKIKMMASYLWSGIFIFCCWKYSFFFWRQYIFFENIHFWSRKNRFHSKIFSKNCIANYM